MTELADGPSGRRGRSATLARIQSLIDFWDITAEELASHTAPPPPIKYRHPVSGATWDGRGEHPAWLRHALLQEGWRVDELRPAPAPESGPDAATADTAT